MIDPSINMAALASIEQAINGLLSLDPVSLKRIARLDGQVVHACSAQPKLDIYVRLQEDGIALMSYYDGDSDCKIEGSARDLMHLLSADSTNQGLHQSNLQINGNAGLIIELQRIAQSAELDFEALFARIFGDVVAHKMMLGLSEGISWLRQGRQRFEQNISEYLQEETRQLPPKAEVELFYQGLDQVRLGADRVDARLAELKRKIDAQLKDKRET